MAGKQGSRRAEPLPLPSYRSSAAVTDHAFDVVAGQAEIPQHVLVSRPQRGGPS
jgi:hypothetical protein